MASSVEARVAREIATGEASLERIVEEDQDVTVLVPLTPLAYQILVAVQRKTQRRRGDVIDQLLREHGAEMPA